MKKLNKILIFGIVFIAVAILFLSIAEAQCDQDPCADKASDETCRCYADYDASGKMKTNLGTCVCNPKRGNKGSCGEAGKSYTFDYRFKCSEEGGGQPTCMAEPTWYTGHYASYIDYDDDMRSFWWGSDGSDQHFAGCVKAKISNGDVCDAALSTNLAINYSESCLSRTCVEITEAPYSERKCDDDCNTSKQLICCESEDCTQNVDMDPEGSGKCDANADGRFYGTPSCAGGWTTKRANGEPINPGTCGCINDNPPVYETSGTMTTIIPATFTPSITFPVRWFDLTVLGDGLGTDQNDRSYVIFNYSLDGITWHGNNNFSDTGTDTTSAFLSGLTSSSLAFNFSFYTTDNAFTPKITQVRARSLPRLYNSTNNIVQGTGETRCSAVTKTITCQIEGEIGSFVDCTGIPIEQKSVSYVRGILNDGRYRENNLFDNFKTIQNQFLCVDLTSQTLRIPQGGTCNDNMDCVTACCSLNTCVMPEIGYTEEGYIFLVSSLNPENYCGIEPWQSCTSDEDCSTTCCSVDGQWQSCTSDGDCSTTCCSVDGQCVYRNPADQTKGITEAGVIVDCLNDDVTATVGGTVSGQD